MWHGLVVCPQLYMCAPWGKALLPSGSWFPYQTQRVRLDRVYMSFSYFKVLSQCKFTNIYTHTFYLLYKQTTGQKTGIWVIWIPNTTLIFQNYSLPSNQVKPDSFSWLSRSYYHLTAVLILSPTHLHLSPLCSSLSSNAPTTLPPAFIHAVSELPSLSIINLACLCGGRLVGSIPDSPSWPHACVMSPGLWCFRGQVHVCSLSVPTGPSFPILSTFRSFVLFCHWKGSRGEGTSLISHSRVRTHLR